MNIKVSVVISAYNEEKNIEECLDSVKDFADEIIVIDNSSTDKTNQLAKKYTKHVFERKNNLMLNVNKNYGFSKTTHEWILNLDADERLTPELAHEIEQQILIVGNDVNGFYIPRKNIIFGKWIENSIWWPDYQLRLFKKGKGKFPEKHVHELLEVEGTTAKLTQPLVHYNYTSISQWIYKMDRIYTENEVENQIKEGKKVTFFDAIRYPINDFLKTFFMQKGYKDGLHGLVLSFLQAFYAEVVFAKMWERQGFPEENSPKFLKQVYKEFQSIGNEIKYWFLTETLSETRNKLKKLRLRIARKRAKGKI